MSNYTKVSNDIIYTGVDDTTLDLFESQYVVPEGMSYNSYVILDEKIALLDTADARCQDQWLQNVTNALQGRQPEYLVSLHMEPDHSASIAKAMQQWPSLKLVAGAMALKFFAQFNEDFDVTGRTVTVNEGCVLELGKHSLQFIAAPMVHWPEVMMCYDKTDKVLFSADAFGKFGALEHETDDWDCEARRYYFNICGKYGAQVQSVLKKVSAFDVETICPLHGPVLHAPLDHYLKQYSTWSQYKPESEGTLIAVASIHGGTLQAAEQLAEILRENSPRKVVVSDLSRDDMAEVIEDAFRYDTIVLCAASYDAGVFPPMYDFLHHLIIKGYCNKRVAIIENGTWAPSAGNVMKQMVEQMKNMTLVEPIITIRSRLHKADIPALQALAKELI